MQLAMDMLNKKTELIITAHYLKCMYIPTVMYLASYNIKTRSWMTKKKLIVVIMKNSDRVCKIIQTGFGHFVANDQFMRRQSRIALYM